MFDAQCTTYLSSTGELDAQLFGNSVDCIKLVDLNGHVIKLNPGALDALELDSLDAMYGKPWVGLWPDESKDVVAEAIATATRGERTRFSAYCPTAKGTPRWWDVVVSPVLNVDGNITQLMAVSRDVTDVHLAREALREADVRKDEFLAILAHELRNPLSATAMAATILESHKIDIDRTAQLGKLISRQVGHMTRLVEDLIDISRISRGLIVLNNAPVDMRLVINDTLEQLEGQVKDKGHAIHVSLADDDCSVSGDRTRLLQVLGNLVGNAVRYTPAGGRVDISMSCAPEAVLITIADTGVGIAPERMSEVFGLFTQGDRTSERNTSGLGLGLALVQKLVDLHGGTVSAFSAGEGHGSTFILSLPRLA